MHDRFHPISSEEDVRAKVVTQWLYDCGFGVTDILTELPFKIRLGRQEFFVADGKVSKTAPTTQSFRPRADVLVHSRDHRNLLVVEVKAPNEPLDDAACSQGISYARLLSEGGIAPFAVITNGRETKIFDSISGEMINGSQVPNDHPYVKRGFRISADILALRSEALEAIISISPDNFIMFCQAQVDSRMRILRGDDLYSGKKYIPSLYVERSTAKEKMTRLLDGVQESVVVLTGPPQVGKTNFLCHFVEERLARGLACLFYPAIGMQQGLLHELAEDFEWLMGETISPYHVVHNRLARIAHLVNQRVVIFIDGWNEAEINLAREIISASGRLAADKIQLVISVTDIALDRLLQDDAGNPSHIAELAKIDRRISSYLPEMLAQQSKVELDRYGDEEMPQAYEKYAQVFNVQITRNHHYVRDPFLLRIAMNLYHGKVLPDELDEAQLIEQSIAEKIGRATKLQNFSAEMFLRQLAEELFSKGAPVPQAAALQRWGLPIVHEVPDGLFEAALLAKVRDWNEGAALDFYFARERDFVVACWARRWSRELLVDDQSVIFELKSAMQTEVGISALGWFLRQPKFRDCLRHAITLISEDSIPDTGDPGDIVQKFLSLAFNSDTHLGKTTYEEDDLSQIASLLIPLLTDEKEDVRLGH